MASITDIILAPALGAFFYDDQAAIRRGVEHNGFAYVGDPQTSGFDRVRIPAAALSLGLVLDNGAVAWGDMVSVQYSGAAGRDPLFERGRIADAVRNELAPVLVGRDAADAQKNCDVAFSVEPPLPAAVRYGASQALLAASAQVRQLTMAEVVAQSFGLNAPTDSIPMFAQSGDDRHLNVDKMVMKRVDILPHGLINSREKFGPDGETFLDYAKWVAARAQELGAEDYNPVLHFDMYGWVGLGYSQEPSKVAEFIARTADAVAGHQLHIEAPADYRTKAAQLDNYAAIVRELEKLGSDAKVVADEYCNTLADIRDFCDAKAAHLVQIKTPDVGSLFDTARAIAYAKATGIGAYCGGTSAETDVSARACVHVALAMRADMMLAKPGMGVDEGICIVGNEQSRTLAQIRHHHGMEALI